jgi:peroxiredoxin
MTDRPAPSVCQLLADLHAYRLEHMASADLQVNIDQRRLLEETADRNAFVKPGDVVEPFSLPEVLGGTVELDRLLATGPVVLLPLPGRVGHRQRAGRRFGITFTASAASQARIRARGGDLGEVLGTSTWELPMPTIVVIDRSRVVCFADVHPDWLVRTEAAPVIDAVRSLTAVPA